MTLSIITDPQDPLLDYVKDDPVRPEIPREFRVAKNRFVSALIEDKPTAMVCVNLLAHIPTSVGELGEEDSVDTAVFYTIWSYKPGAGQELLNATVARIKQEFPAITRFVTLSPKTEMARRFHLQNGATVFRENSDTINYEYTV